MKKEGQYLGVDKSAEVCGIWSRNAADQMGEITNEALQLETTITSDGNIAGGAGVEQKAGFVFEELHKFDANAHSTLKGNDYVFYTDKHPQWPLCKNHTKFDIVVMKDGDIIKGWQLKNYATKESLAQNILKFNKDGTPKYGDVKIVVPKELKEPLIKYLKTAKFRSPEKQALATKLADNIVDKLGGGKSISRETTLEIIKGTRKGRSELRKIIGRPKTQSTLQQAGKAAVGAAAITTVIAGTINTVNCLRMVREGKIKQEDAVKYILKNTAIAATDSAAKAATAAGAVSLTARALPTLFNGTMLRASLATNAVGGAAICVMDLVQGLVKVAAGKMSWRELEERSGKNLFQVGAGSIGAAVGAAIGIVGGPIGSAIGSFVGGMITALAATVLIENQIEKPFFELMADTKELIEAERMMNIAIGYLADAGISMEEFKKGLLLSERDFDDTMSHIRQKRNANRLLIDSL